MWLQPSLPLAQLCRQLSPALLAETSAAACWALTGSAAACMAGAGATGPGPRQCSRALGASWLRARRLRLLRRGAQRARAALMCLLLLRLQRQQQQLQQQQQQQQWQWLQQQQWQQQQQQQRCPLQQLLLAVPRRRSSPTGPLCYLGCWRCWRCCWRCCPPALAAAPLLCRAAAARQPCGLRCRPQRWLQGIMMAGGA
jgi:hypothetical protein